LIRTFWFITIRSFKNRMLSRLKRLREPRYLVGFMAGLAYIWFMGLKRLFAMHELQHGIVGVRIPTGPFIVDCLGLIVLVPILFAWALPDQEGGLVFSEAEIQFLFPAPLSRRQLLMYKVLRQQPQILISAAMMSLFGFGASRFVGLWIAFVTAAIYFTAVSLARARLKLAGIGFLIRFVVVIAALAGIATMVVHAYASLNFRSLDGATPAKGMSLLDQPLQTAPFRVLLFIPRFFSAAMLPTSLTQLGLACAALVVIAFVLLQIAARLNVSFEDASIRAAQKKQGYIERVRGFRSGRRVMFGRIPPPFRLPAHPSPELAILWKNLIATLRISIAWMVIIGALFAILIGESLYGHNAVLHATTASMALFLCGLFPLMASGVLAQDMRLDLQRIEILKSYPISGERLIAAEIAAPLTIMSIVEFGLLGGTMLMLHLPNESATLQRIATPEFAVIALLFAIPICAMQLLIRNAAAVLFPGWSMRSQDDPKGFVIMGQRLILLASNLFVLGVALIPSAIIVLLGWLISSHFSSTAALPLATVPAVALLFGEVWLGIKLLGAQFEKIDVTNEMGSAVL
jgi:hypothetical protein